MQANQVRFWSLKTKLVVFSGVLLLLPLLGVSFLRQLEQVLVDNMMRELTSYARSVSFSVAQIPDQFERPLIPVEEIAQALYFPLSETPIVVDGFDDDWRDALGFAKRYQSTDTAFNLAVVQQQGHLFLRVKVFDRTPVLQSRSDGKSPADSIEIELFASGERSVFMTFVPAAVGLISPKIEKRGVETIWVSSAVWQQTADGYLLEAKIPNFLNWQALKVTVNNFIPQQVQFDRATSATEKTNRLLEPSLELQSQLKRLVLQSGRRVWLLDSSGHLLARAGDLSKQLELLPVNPLLHLILSPPDGDFTDPRSRAVELSIPAVKQALQGIAGTTLESVGSSDQAIALVAVPVVFQQQTVGVVVVEENVAAVQLIQRQAMNLYINAALFSLLAVVLVLIFYASRLTHRIARLTQSATDSVDAHGRLVRVIETDKANDEIGDLSRSFASMSRRVTDYNDYLEKLASRVTHELRTPIAMIRSSIDRIEPSDSGQQSALDNAKLGVERMSQLIARMSEASRLEQSVLQVTLEPINVTPFFVDYCQAYNQIKGSSRVLLDAPNSDIIMVSSHELLAQMLDKLLTNAQDFAIKDTTIQLVVRHDSECLSIAVLNQGQSLPDVAPEQLFESLHSHRAAAEKVGDNLHLGLGLYLVRLIAEAHRGRYFARNLADQSGVMIGVELPVH